MSQALLEQWLLGAFSGHDSKWVNIIWCTSILLFILNSCIYGASLMQIVIITVINNLLNMKLIDKV